jgi:hypothetical protein
MIFKYYEGKDKAEKGMESIKNVAELRKNVARRGFDR